jgi:hypothetical protein
MRHRSPNTGNIGLRIVGGTMLIGGLLLLVGSGLCTLFVIGSASPRGTTQESPLGLLLIFGGLPMLIGGFVAWLGYGLWQQGAPSPPELPPPEVRDDCGA